jgi:hypothetical protein
MLTCILKLIWTLSFRWEAFEQMASPCRINYAFSTYYHKQTILSDRLMKSLCTYSEDWDWRWLARLVTARRRRFVWNLTCILQPYFCSKLAITSFPFLHFSSRANNRMSSSTERNSHMYIKQCFYKVIEIFGERSIQEWKSIVQYVKQLIYTGADPGIFSRGVRPCQKIFTLHFFLSTTRKATPTPKFQMIPMSWESGGGVAK